MVMSLVEGNSVTVSKSTRKNTTFLNDLMCFFIVDDTMSSSRQRMSPISTQKRPKLSEFFCNVISMHFKLLKLMVLLDIHCEVFGKISLGVERLLMFPSIVSVNILF